MTTQINMYRSAGEWCYAAWIDGEYDSSDVIGCPDSASREEAEAEVLAIAAWPSPVTVSRVADVS